MAGDLIGIGLYTAAEAGLLVQVPPAKIIRWLRGYEAHRRHYEPLWHPQVPQDGEGATLGFGDLMEVRVAASFIAEGLPPHRVRQAIRLARDAAGEDRPLSTHAFRTDGHSLFVEVVEEDGEPALIDLFRQQYTFRDVVERSLKHVDYDDAGRPSAWWPLGPSRSVLLDPARSFGQPIEAETSVPVAALVGAVRGEGSAEAAAEAWGVPARAVRRALFFHDVIEGRRTAG
ncbi:hypothetical protein [Lichenibacterium dinghuense]|uniref:hypothetical protein n=1 Tax=Lichenibacterium dinghuense TaxID=2895977 RepID=UPI001F1E7CC8|nr:hypothetical protein [Lichenibacterium sp. 6Y81]